MIGLGTITTEKWIRTRRVTASEGEVFYARHRVLGTDVLVHLLPASARARYDAIVGRVAAMSENEKASFLDAGVRPGGYYVVTAAEPYYEDLSRIAERATISPVDRDIASVVV